MEQNENMNEIEQEQPKQERQRVRPKATATSNPLAVWFIGVLFTLFSAGVLFWTASLTLGVIDIVLPGNPIVKYFALALFDGGALIWAGVYILKAKGTPQRGISLLMTGVNLAGVILMVIGAVYLSGQQLVAIPEGLGNNLILGVIAATIANLTAGYYFHLNDPDNRVKIALQNFNDMIFEESLRQAEADVRANAREHGAIMALGLMAQFKYDLGLPMSKAEKKALTEDVIDAQEIAVPELPSPAPRVLPSWWIGVLRWLGKYKPVNVINPTDAAPSNAAGSTDTPNPDNA